LPGEREPAPKDPAPLSGSITLAERRNMEFSGMAAARGSGRVVVTTAGMHTAIGRLASLLDRIGEERTPLQREIDFVGRTLGIARVATALAVVVTVPVTSDVTAVSEVVEVLVFGVSPPPPPCPKGCRPS
jgi:P-type Ca2+ transporter type 2C